MNKVVEVSVIYYFACSNCSILFNGFYVLGLSAACKISLELTISSVLILLLGSESCVMGLLSLCLVVAGGCFVQV